MNKETLVYYTDSDVQKYICQKLNISEDDYCSYHKVIGGGYKDLWQVWLTLVSDMVENGTYQTHFFDLLGFEGAVKEYGDWVMVLHPILDEMFKEYGGEDGSLVVYYNW